MANISVRNLDNKIYEKLCNRAAKHGVSMEEEVRQIIFEAVSTHEKISHIFQKNFGPQNGIDLESTFDSSPHPPMDFDE